MLRVDLFIVGYDHDNVAVTEPEIDQLLGDPEHVVVAVPEELLPKLWHAQTLRGRITGAVYRASYLHHRTLTEVDRRSVLAVDAASHGAGALARRLRFPDSKLMS